MTITVENQQKSLRTKVLTLAIGLLLWLLGIAGSVVMLTMGLGRSFENPLLPLGTVLFGIVGFLMVVVQVWRITRARRRQQS
ncbi:MAG: hypothetical protein FWD18_00325 [Micrococcales bacterium]|nr:hypothetical protein [Micrococcales bacterium]